MYGRGLVRTRGRVVSVALVRSMSGAAVGCSRGLMEAGNGGRMVHCGVKVRVGVS